MIIFTTLPGWPRIKLVTCSGMSEYVETELPVWSYTPWIQSIGSILPELLAVPA